MSGIVDKKCKNHPERDAVALWEDDLVCLECLAKASTIDSKPLKPTKPT